MKDELERLSFAKILGKTLKLYADHFIPLLLISFVCTLPAIGLDILAEVLETSRPSLSRLLGILLFFVMIIGTYMLCAAFMTEWIFKKPLNRPQRLTRYLGNVKSLLLPVIMLALIATLMMGGPAVILYLLHGEKAAIILYIYIIPGIFLLIGLVLAAPVKVMEGKTVIKSLKRSFALTSKHKLEILAYLLIIGLIKRLLIDRLLVGGFILERIADMNISLDTQQLLAQGVSYLVEILFNPVSACLFILVYINLRVKQEGIRRLRSLT
jgi:membrane-anchored glycerophosphoryl diester phosphodiesterase (GDPDase)